MRRIERLTPFSIARSALTICSIGLAIAPLARGAFDFEPTWRTPEYGVVRQQVLQWLEQANLDPDVADLVRREWPGEAAEQNDAVLDGAVAAFALADQRIQALVDRCQQSYVAPTLPDAAWLTDENASEFVRHNVRLYYGRWLAQHALYDEALEQLAELRVEDVIDPAALLFYRMVAYHQLVRPEEARAELVQLMERQEELPRRYQQLGKLVLRDLSALKDESLDHIARRMSDIRRRLNYGRAGERVQGIERGVVESLDKLIEQAESQQQQAQSQQQQGGGAAPSAKPMQDSRLAELKGPGRVDRRDIGNTSGWGELPPKEREQALQQIGREFPAHYREVIEQYFRELANEETKAAP